MGREGLAIPGRGDWSLSTPEERRAAIFLRNRVLQADINPATGEISEGAGKYTRIKIKVPERGTTSPSPLDGDTGKARGPHPKTPAQREIIKVKPKPVRGRQAESLLNMLGMQIEPGQGRRALEQLKTVLPGLNTKTGRVFALVPSRDAKGQLKAGAIPIPAAEKLRDLVYAHVRS